MDEIDYERRMAGRVGKQDSQSLAIFVSMYNGRCADTVW